MLDVFDEDEFEITLGLESVISCSSLNTSFYFTYFFLSLPPWNRIFYRPRVGAYTSSESTAANMTDQKISDITILMAEYGYQYKSILPAKVPPIITIK